jgi:hypothetical protein
MRLAALLTLAAATGCGLLPPALPDWIVNRQPLPSCGEEVLEQGQAGDVEMRTCLLEAYRDGRPAELISTFPTIEGDPITQYIRVHENGVVEIFVDATRDRFGSGAWERMVCDELTPVDEADDQSGRVFVEAGCEVLPVP